MVEDKTASTHQEGKQKPKKKKRKDTESAIWKKILKRDLQLSELQFYAESLSAEMTHMAFELEKKRSTKTKDYIK